LRDSSNNGETQTEEFTTPDVEQWVEQGIAASEAVGKDSAPKKDDGSSRSKRQPRQRTVDNKKRPATGRKADLTEDLTSMLASFAMPLFAFSAKNPKLAYDAYIITVNAEKTAVALNELARKNPIVHRVLHTMMTGTDSVMLLNAVANMAIPIAANHGLVPTGLATAMGAPDPESFNPLEAMQDAS
jgi:hypothetical protein